ncbi:HYD1 signature containing ADP-ribosyltransferase family protein [Streptomyces sp. NPDC127068]|uniref:HYD1 signature containing ADP-ribosyltransferase family protein n=1 Tax=Streptomyces sp. NPDC127068 TaxID=3347127 RepID=UPI0036645A36
MFGRRHTPAPHTGRRFRLAVIPAVSAALLVGLLPATAFAVPPVPTTGEVVGRDTLELESLTKEQPVPGEDADPGLASLRVDFVPENQQQAPAGTDTPPPAATATVSFGSPTTPAAFGRATAGAATPPPPLPVGNLPVSLGQAPNQPAPTGTWQVSVAARTAPVAAGVDGTVLTVQAPATGSVPVRVKLDYGKFANLYGAGWASRLRLVQFPECYLTTPTEEACQQYEPLESANDSAATSVTATVDPAADGTGAPPPSGASARTDTAPGVVPALHRTTDGGRVTRAAATGDKAVIGAVDSGSGVGGSFKAPPLVSSGKWDAGGSSGAFSWSYPVTVPAPPAGPAPAVTLGYNSQSVDGRTSVSSPQASWVGDGWNYDPGHIERRYRSCEEDRKPLDHGTPNPKTPNNTAKKDKTSDLCWASYNAVMSLGGKTTELVRDAPATSNPETDTEIYRPQHDDGTRVERRVGATNGDNDGEHWVVTTTDGTTYYYGLHDVGGGHAVTDSVSTVPVFGNHPGEPCHATTFADSRCGAGKQQAWRWGLDKVVDVHGNAMVIDWQQATNHYSVRKKFKTPEAYDRAAYPNYIEYGMRAADLTKPSAKVDFVVAERCLASATVCAPAKFDQTADPGAYRAWWDTPGNLNCKATSDLCPTFPSFWSRIRLSEITTYGQRPGAAALQKVDTYALKQSFPQDLYSLAPGLWLDSITRRGFAPGDPTGTLQHEDGVSFGPYSVGSTSPLRKSLKDKYLPNLVPKVGPDERPPFIRPRIGSVATEAGGEVSVEYTGGCRTEPAADKGRNNGTCYPVRWSPDGEVETPSKAWFNKYVVASVTEVDKVTTHGKPVHVKYAYQQPAWSLAEDEFQPPALRTHSDWRGYRQVSVTKGMKSITKSSEENPKSHSLSRTRYYLGTGEDLEDSTGALQGKDEPQYAGTTAETLVYDHSGGKVVRRVLNHPWSQETASRKREADGGVELSALKAHRTGIRRTDAIQQLDNGSWRAVRNTTEVDPDHGLPVESETSVVKPTSGGGETLSDRTCTKTSYVHNTTDWLIGLPKEVRTTATSCAGFAAADPATELKSSVRTSYDDLAHGATPTKGAPTSVAGINGEGTAHSVTSTYTYDPLGRPRKVTSPLLGTAETQYTPGDTGGPVTSTKTINAKGHATVTTLDPGRGLPLTVTDPNGRVSRTEYDALGRLTKGWSASRSAGNQTPNVEVSYRGAVATSDKTSPAAVTVRTVKDDGGYGRQVTLYDGLLRQFQTQAEAHGPGRIISDTKYDERGLVSEQTSGYLAKGEPVTDPFQARSPTLIPSTVKSVYDAQDRVTKQAVYHGRDFRYLTTTKYADTSTLVNPPGDTSPSTRTFTDALGRVESIRHYTKSDDASAWRATAYSYDARGYRDKVTDPEGNIWAFTHDARGRLTDTVDPDSGTTHTTYDAADRAVSVRDAKQRTTYTEYDELSRVTKVRHGSSTADPAMTFTFDAPGALGLPVASTRHTSAGDYVNKVTGYDTEYRPIGRQTQIPSNPMTTGLSGTYTYAYAYTPTGKPHSVTLPAKGGLAAETVVTRYDGDGLPESTSGLNWYTSDVTYSPYGEVLRSVTGSQPDRLWTTNFVDRHTGRLQRTVTDRETAGPHRVADGYYAYDVTGAVTAHARKLADAAGSSWDNQCFTHDTLRQVVHAWTSNIAPTGTGTGCKAQNGSSWGYRTDGAPSSGPVAEALGTPAQPAGPDNTLTTSLAAAAPATGTVAGGATGYRQSYTFDTIGNRATMTDHDPATPANDVTHTYRYGKQVPGNGTTPAHEVQPHTLTSVTRSTGGGSTYAYDVIGNTESRALPATTQQLQWTQENKLDSLTDSKSGTTTRYVYDAAGNRLLENSPTGSTLYLGETELTTNASGTITRASRTYTQSGAPAVTRTTNNGSTTAHLRSALITDHLGTANTTVELTGNQTVTRRAHKPYGEVRGPQPATWPNKRGYLGVGIENKVTGLTNIGARDYDAETGRFISIDPIMDLADPLQINGYAYANNTPISSSDPTGLYAGHCVTVQCMESTRGSTSGSGTVGGNYGHCGSAQCTVQTSGGGGAQGYTGGGTSGSSGIGVQQPVVKKKSFVDRFVNTIRDEGSSAVSAVTGLWEQAAADVLGCATGDESCGALLDYSPPAMAYDSVQGIGDRATEIADDFSNGRMAEASAKLTFDVALAGLAKKAPAKSKGSSCAPGNSFTAGTLVAMAAGGQKPIEDVKIGDEVLATDPRTGKTVAKKVTATIFGDGQKHLVKISVAAGEKKGARSGDSSIVATDGHPFWLPELRKWVDATDLAVGQLLRTSSGTHVQITAIKRWTQQAAVYNLTVADLHTYYVLAGATPVLVHNCGDGPESASEGPQSLYHYTNETGHDGITASGAMRPSLKANNPKDARYGDGQYLTDIQPGTKTLGQLSAAFLRVPWAGRKFTHYLEIDVSGLNVLEGRPGVFVIPNSGPLDLTGRIRSSGRN